MGHGRLASVWNNRTRASSARASFSSNSSSMPRNDRSPGNGSTRSGAGRSHPFPPPTRPADHPDLPRPVSRTARATALAAPQAAGSPVETTRLTVEALPAPPLCQLGRSPSGRSPPPATRRAVSLRATGRWLFRKRASQRLAGRSRRTGRSARSSALAGSPVRISGRGRNARSRSCAAAFLGYRVTIIARHLQQAATTRDPSHADRDRAPRGGGDAVTNSPRRAFSAGCCSRCSRVA